MIQKSRRASNRILTLFRSLNRILLPLHHVGSDLSPIESNFSVSFFMDTPHGKAFQDGICTRGVVAGAGVAGARRGEWSTCTTDAVHSISTLSRASVLLLSLVGTRGTSRLLMTWMAVRGSTCLQGVNLFVYLDPPSITKSLRIFGQDGKSSLIWIPLFIPPTRLSVGLQLCILSKFVVTIPPR